MGKKKPVTRPLPQSEFRESDFAGRPPQDQRELSGSLNRLSEELASTLQLLEEIERNRLPAPAPDTDSPDSATPHPPPT